MLVPSTVPDSGLNHVGRHIRPAPSGPAYLLLSGAKVSRQSEPSAADTDKSVWAEMWRQDGGVLWEMDGEGISLHL